VREKERNNEREGEFFKEREIERKSVKLEEFIFYKMEEGEEEWKREREIGRIMKKKWKKERNSERERL
jgi:hypothetical protein